MLLKGLAEQNGAFILDALEAWPECQTLVDEQGVESTILPPIYYLIWLKPLEPFESCYFQHIDDYDEQLQQYTAELFSHLSQSGLEQHSLVITLLQRLSEYSDLHLQAGSVKQPNFIDLLLSRNITAVVKWALESGFKLTPEQVCECWKNKALREVLEANLPDCLIDEEATVELAMEASLAGKPYFELLSILTDEEQVKLLLEKAFLKHIQRDQVKQAELLAYVKQGATGQLEDAHGRNTLMFAIEKGFVSLVEQLLEHQDLSKVDATGRGLLHFAVISNSKAMIDLLMDAGCESRQRDHQGVTPYRLALKQSALMAKKALEQHGIIELSEEAQHGKIKQVHIIVSIVAMLLPVQFVLFFSEAVTAKAEVVGACAGASLLLIWWSKVLKSASLYPKVKHPWSLSCLYGLGYFSTMIQALFLAFVLLTIVSL